MEAVVHNAQNKSGRKTKIKTNTFVLTYVLLRNKPHGSEYEIKVL